MKYDDIQRQRIIELYRRRCSRILALFNGGRIITDNIVIHRTNMMRIAYESIMKELT